MTKIYRELQEKETTVAPERIKNIFFGVEKKQYCLLELFQKHNEDVLKLIGISKSKATYQKYEIYLQTSAQCSHNTTAKFCSFLKESFLLQKIMIG